MFKAQYLETTHVADVEELLHSGGPDLVIVRGAGDPDAFAKAQGHEYPDRQRILEAAVDSTSGMSSVVATADAWLETRFPGLVTDGRGFQHDATVKTSSEAHVDTAVAEKLPDIRTNHFRGPLSLSAAVNGNATWRGIRIKPYAIRPNAQGLYRARRLPLFAKELVRTVMAGKMIEFRGGESVVQRPGDYAVFASLPWHTYHAVVAEKGRRAELFDMRFINDPRHWG